MALWDRDEIAREEQRKQDEAARLAEMQTRHYVKDVETALPSGMRVVDLDSFLSGPRPRTPERNLAPQWSPPDWSAYPRPPTAEDVRRDIRNEPDDLTAYALSERLERINTRTPQVTSSAEPNPTTTLDAPPRPIPPRIGDRGYVLAARGANPPNDINAVPEPLPALHGVRGLYNEFLGLEGQLKAGEAYYGRRAGNQSGSDTRELVLDRYNFTPQAQDWLRQNSIVNVEHPTDESGGGGGFYPSSGLVKLNGIQGEAAVHELSHAWWHQARKYPDMAQGLVETVYRIAVEQPREYPDVARLAKAYMLGNWEGSGSPLMRLSNPNESTTGWNDWEIFAGLASGTMGDLNRMPPELRPYYRTLFLDNTPR